MATYFLLRLDLSTRNNEFFFVLSEFPLRRPSLGGVERLLWAFKRHASVALKAYNQKRHVFGPEEVVKQVKVGR